MKIGIVTITELDNFGNRLQNYALQQTLKKYGHEVETIRNYITYRYRKKRTYKVVSAMKGGIMYAFGRKRKIAELFKQKRFEAFDKRYFSFSHFYSEKNFISPKLNESYDAFIAGSDQIWNPYFVFNFDFNFLTFSEKRKRISYAASFGVDNIPKEKQHVFSEYINGMNCLSVREYAGAEIIFRLTGKEAQVVLDPTMLLTAREWRKFSKRPKWLIDERYILTYYLGSTNDRHVIFEKLYENNDIYRKYKIIDICNFNNLQSYAITPDEFVWLVDHAEFMVTDSFHGSVFSLLLNTKLIVVDRKDSAKPMNSRIDTLFKTFNLSRSEFIVDSGEKASFETILKEKREESVSYLTNALLLKNG